jgi:hypothetical protein
LAITDSQDIPVFSYSLKPLSQAIMKKIAQRIQLKRDLTLCPGNS